MLAGAAEHLVTLRSKVQVYNINRPLKYWATWFLLKSLTSSGKIHRWNAQKQTLLAFLRLSDGTFRRQLAELKSMGLLQLERAGERSRDKNIILASYSTAAQVMDIPYKGEVNVPYKPHEYANETQVFRYLIVASEIQSNQRLQLGELNRKFQKNLSGNATEILLALKAVGADPSAVQSSPEAFQQALLKLQKAAFRDRSELAGVAFSLRADVNRSCSTWASQHGYAHAVSASFLKRKLVKIKAITVQKTCVHSQVRTRLYVPGADGTRRDGYKWFKGPKTTVWLLCDQISVTLHGAPPAPGSQKKAA